MVAKAVAMEVTKHYNSRNELKMVVENVRLWHQGGEGCRGGGGLAATS